MIKMNAKIKNFFGVGDMFFSLMTVLDNAFLMIFLTDALKLPLAITATAVTITSLGDLLTSFIAGGVVDKSRFKWGKYRSWLLFGPAVAVVFFVMQFSKIGNEATNAIVFIVTYIVGHFLWNIFYTANRALAGTVSDDPSERAHISGRISAWMNLGRIIGSKLVIFLIGFFAIRSSATMGYTYTAILLSVMMAFGYYIHFKITEGYDQYAEMSNEKKVTNNVSILDMFKGIAKNPPLISVLFGDLLRCSGYYIMLALVAYYANIVLKNPAGIGNILLFLNVGNLLGSLFTKNVVDKIGTKWTTIFGMLGASAFMIIAMLFSSDSLTLLVLLGISQFFFGISFGLTTGLYANCAVYAEYKTQKNTTGFIMGLISFSIKVSIFFRGIVITSLLAFIGYSADMTITDQIAGNVSLIFFMVPAILISLGVIPLLFLKLKDSEVIKMRAEIETRKKELANNIKAS